MVKIRSHYSGPDNEADNFMLEVDILKGRMDAMQSLLDYLTSDECTVSKMTLPNNPDHKLNKHLYSGKEVRNALDLSVQSPKQTLSFNPSVELAISQTTQDCLQNVQFSPQSTK